MRPEKKGLVGAGDTLYFPLDWCYAQGTGPSYAKSLSTPGRIPGIGVNGCPFCSSCLSQVCALCNRSFSYHLEMMRETRRGCEMSL